VQAATPRYWIVLRQQTNCNRFPSAGRNVSIGQLLMAWSRTLSSEFWGNDYEFWSNTRLSQCTVTDFCVHTHKEILSFTRKKLLTNKLEDKQLLGFIMCISVYKPMYHVLSVALHRGMTLNMTLNICGAFTRIWSFDISNGASDVKIFWSQWASRGWRGSDTSLTEWWHNGGFPKRGVPQNHENQGKLGIYHPITVARKTHTGLHVKC
jgi:hypothetical protein